MVDATVVVEAVADIIMLVLGVATVVTVTVLVEVVVVRVVVVKAFV